MQRIHLAMLLAFFLPTMANSQIHFHSDLEDTDVACFEQKPKGGCKGWMGIHDDIISVARGEIFHSGKKALKIEFVKNEDYGGSWRKTNSRHIFTRFYDYYDEGFDFAAGMKINRFSAFNDTTQINDFDIILQTKADEPDRNYCGMTDAKYLALSSNGGPVDWGSVEAKWTPMRKRWYAIETEIKLNTPGRADGEMRIWVDGHLLAEKTAMNITGEKASPINRVMFGGWYSNSSAGKNPCPDPVGPSRRYVDDLVISGSSIGARHKTAIMLNTRSAPSKTAVSSTPAANTGTSTKPEAKISEAQISAGEIWEPKISESKRSDPKIEAKPKAPRVYRNDPIPD